MAGESSTICGSVGTSPVVSMPSASLSEESLDWLADSLLLLLPLLEESELIEELLLLTSLLFCKGATGIAAGSLAMLFDGLLSGNGGTVDLAAFVPCSCCRL